MRTADSKARWNHTVGHGDEAFDIAGELDVAEAQPRLMLLEHEPQRMARGERRTDLRNNQQKIRPAIAPRSRNRT